MDQLSAHLDRGWDLVQRGDTRGAHASAQRALELDPGSAEAHNLLGYVAAMEGETDEAMEAYRQALALDDTYLEAMLNAAEVCIHPLGEFDEAIDLCDQALDLAEVDEEIIDALLLRFDALLGKGDLDEAKRTIARIPDGPYENPTHTFLLGRAFYEIGEAEKAATLLRDAVKRDPLHGEAWYYMGLLLDEKGETRAATEAFLRARDLDAELGLPPWAPAKEAFGGLARKAIAGLFQALRRYVESAELYVADLPGVELVADGVDPRAAVLIDGGHDDGPTGPRPVRVFIYANNVARLASGPENLEAEIAQALEREITATFLETEQSERSEKELN